VKRISSKREEKGGGHGSGSSVDCCLGFMVVKGQRPRERNSLYFLSLAFSLKRVGTHLVFTERLHFFLSCPLDEKNL